MSRAAKAALNKPIKKMKPTISPGLIFQIRHVVIPDPGGHVLYTLTRLMKFRVLAARCERGEVAKRFIKERYVKN